MGIEYALVCNCGAVLDEEHWRKPIDIMRIGSDDLDVREEWHKFIAKHLTECCKEIHVVNEYIAEGWQAMPDGPDGPRMPQPQKAEPLFSDEDLQALWKWLYEKDAEAPDFLAEALLGCLGMMNQRDYYY